MASPATIADQPRRYEINISIGAGGSHVSVYCEVCHQIIAQYDRTVMEWTPLGIVGQALRDHCHQTVGPKQAP